VVNRVADGRRMGYILRGEDLRDWSAIAATRPTIGRTQCTQFSAGRGKPGVGL